MELYVIQEGNECGKREQMDGYSGNLKIAGIGLLLKINTL
jgi:hypothetical protein